MNGRISCPVILLAMAIFWSPCIGLAYEHLLFFRATEDRMVYEKDPDAYLRRPPTSNSVSVYIEKVSALSIPMKDVDSVLLKYQEVTEFKKLEDGTFCSRRMGKYVYLATISLRREAWPMLKRFTTNHKGDTIAVAFDSQWIAAPAVILDVIDAGVSTIYLEEENEERLRELLAPLKDKLTWGQEAAGFEVLDNLKTCE